VQEGCCEPWLGLTLKTHRDRPGTLEVTLPPDRFIPPGDPASGGAHDPALTLP
jgi:hypothetical protein